MNAKLSIYDDGAMAQGYACHRPALHRPIIARIQQHLGWHRRAGRALDIGCGSGLSTALLAMLAERCYGLEPSTAMLRWALQIAPGACFVSGMTQQLPFPSCQFDLITAAGSLNYVDLPQALAEISRVMKSEGVLVIYDFSQGRSFVDSELLDIWFSEFIRRYPPANDAWQPISQQSLDNNEIRGVRLQSFEPFEIALDYDTASYADYVMTETNIQHAIKRGDSPTHIRAWCEESLSRIFSGMTRAVLFHGYIAYLAKQGPGAPFFRCSN
jgi:SAM-dependent methyltransferase